MSSVQQGTTRRSPFATAMLATLGVLAALALVAVVGYTVLNPLAESGRRAIYGWSDTERKDLAAQMRISAKGADCMADEWAKLRVTYSDYRASRYTREDAFAVTLNCYDVR